MFISEQLNELTRGSVSPLGILRDLSPAEWTGALPIEPGGQALLAENVFAVEQSRSAERVVADRTGVPGSLDLIVGRGTAIGLEEKRRKIYSKEFPRFLSPL